MGYKVLFAHDGPLQHDGAGRFYGVTLGNTLKDRFLNLGSEVTFMLRTRKLHAGEEQRFSQIDPDHFHVVDVPDFKSMRNYLKLHKRAKVLVEKTVAEHDIVVARLPSAIGSMAVRAARRIGKPYMVEYVACTFDAYWNYNWKGKLIAHYKMMQQKALVKDVPFIIYVTRQFLQGRYPSSGKQTNCSNVEINAAPEADLIERLAYIETHNPDKPIVLGTVAALNVAYKGQDDVLKAIAKLRQQRKSFTYRLVGHGSAERLRKLADNLGISDAVEIIGPLKHSEVFDFYRSLDLYIQPSKQEGLPRSVIEAMSVSCPVLGSSIAGIPELLNPEMLFTPGDVDGIVKRLLAINSDILVNEAKRNHDEALLYTKTALMRRRLAFYKEFLEANNLDISDILLRNLQELDN